MSKRPLHMFLIPAALLSGLLAASTNPVVAADNVIKIGGLLPISGPGSYFGAQDKQGVELAHRATQQVRRERIQVRSSI